MSGKSTRFPRSRSRGSNHAVAVLWFFPLLLLGFAGPAWSQLPEPLPPYSDARALREDATLNSVAFGSPTVGLAVGDRGTILRTVDGGTTWAMAESGVTCRLEKVLWVDDRNVVAIGGACDRVTQISRGVALWSDDGGQRWRRGTDEELPRLRTLVVRREDDAIVAQGDFSHVALSNRFESRDGGRTWQSSGQKSLLNASHQQDRVPSGLRALISDTEGLKSIRDRCRMDDANGCAVGDHGVIMKSEDAGRSWIVCRGQGRRTAVLVVSASKSSIPWPLIGNESIEMRNRVAVLLGDPQIKPAELDRLRQAVVMMGGGSLDPITTVGPTSHDVPTSRDVPAWSDANVERAIGDWIAIHRPLVLVLDQHLPDSVRSAFSSAAISSGVMRVVSYSFDNRGDTTLHRGGLLSRRGALVGDLWEDALQLVAPSQEPPKSVGLRRLYDAVGNRLQGDSVATGLPVSSGFQLTAPAQRASRRQLQVVQARMRQPKQVAELVQTSRTKIEFSKTLAAMLDRTSQDDRFRLAWSVYRNVVGYSDPDSPIALELQAATLREIADRFPTTSAGKWASLLSDSLEHSLEWRNVRSSLGDAISTGHILSSSRAAEVVPVSPFQVDQGVRQVSAVSPLRVPERTIINLTPTVKASVEVDLPWEFHPLVLLVREASRDRSDDNQLQVADGGSANLRRLETSSLGASPWARLVRTGGPATIVATRAETRPRLDGKMDDPCWISARPSVGQLATIRMAYDDEYVYIAMKCPSEQFRPDSMVDVDTDQIRDHDLDAVDRLRLRLDTDSDLLTSFQLQCSLAGRTHDSIDGYPAWQPTWYVDSHRGDDWVGVEIAILRRDVTELPIHEGQSWFVAPQLLTAGTQTPWQPIPNANDWLRVVFR